MNDITKNDFIQHLETIDYELIDSVSRLFEVKSEKGVGIAQSLQYYIIPSQSSGRAQLFSQIA